MQTRKTLMISTAAIALTMAATSSAQAANTYVSLFGGASFLDKPGLKGTSHTHTTTYQFVSTQSADTGFKTGFVVGGNWGVDWGTFRTEIELGYHQSKSGKTAHVTTSYSYGYSAGYCAANGISPCPAPHLTSSSDKVVPANLNLRAYSLMANVWYDFHGLDLPAGITPYVGAGIGGAEVQMDGSVEHPIYEKNDFVFAWQVGAGASLPVSDSMKVFLDYRYFAADGAKLFLEPGYHGGNVTADFNAHSVIVGLRVDL